MDSVCKEEFFCYQSLSYVEKGGILNYAPFWGSLEFWLDRTGTCTTWLLGLQYKTIIGFLWYLATEDMR